MHHEYLSPTDSALSLSASSANQSIGASSSLSNLGEGGRSLGLSTLKMPFTPFYSFLKNLSILFFLFTIFSCDSLRSLCDPAMAE